SCPVTWWPIWARSTATALIPAPPTLVTWMRRGVDRSSVGRSSATGLLQREAGDVGGGVGASPGAGGLGHRGTGRVVAEERVDLGGQASAVELGVGDEASGSGLHQAAGVGGLLVGGHVRGRDEHGGQADGG